MCSKSIKKYLNEHGITQTFLSSKTGISLVTLSTILNGKRKMLATEYMAICEALNVPLDTFKPE